MPLIDWRDVAPSLLNDAWAEQNARWSGRLSWDATGNWTQIEAERRAGRLPGLVLLDRGTVQGWCFFLIHQDTLQIGGFESRSSTATATLLDAVLASVPPELAPSGAMLFAFSDAPGLVPALGARGFDAEGYLYLVRDTVGERASRQDLTWDTGATAQLPMLLARAYGTPSLTRPFARHGRIEEWREYAAQLFGSAACGAFEPELSAASFSGNGELHGAIVTTIVSPRTAHLAQVVVDPARQGTGLGTALLDAVLGRIGADRFDRASLLVSERNASARRLYERAGFHAVASFVAAGRPAASPR